MPTQGSIVKFLPISRLVVRRALTGLGSRHPVLGTILSPTKPPLLRFSSPVTLCFSCVI